MEKSEVEHRLKSGNLSLKDDSGKKQYKSAIWNDFFRVCEGDKPLDFVACKKCKQVYAYSKSIGTTTILKHKCGNSCNSQLSAYIQRTTVPIAAKRKLEEACVSFVSEDVRPFYLVKGDGFKKLISAAINIGAVYGTVDAGSIIPSRFTVARNTKNAAKIARIKLAEILKQLTENQTIAATTDLWTDDFRKLSYLTITVHYISDDWSKIEERVLCTSHFSEEKTAENIKEKVTECLSSFGISISDVVFVTDKGANIKKALEDQKHIFCAAHGLNLVLSTLFKKKRLDKLGLTFIYDMIQKCKDLVTYFKRSALMEKLPNRLKQSVETRWNSNLMMLESIRSSTGAIRKVLMEVNESNRLAPIDEDILLNLINFLKPFKEFSDVLESSKKVTLHLVFPTKQKLLLYLTPNLNEPQYIEKLKSEAKEILEEKLAIHDYHLIAMFLNPKMRSLKLIDSTAEKEHVLAKVKLMIHQKEGNNAVVFEQNVRAEHLYPSTSMKRKKKTLFEEFEDDNFEEDTMTDEFAMYQNAKFDSNASDLQEFWSANTIRYPKMSQLAKEILAIPATSAPSERNFSTAGRTTEKRRSRIDPETVDDLLMLRSNKDLL